MNQQNLCLPWPRNLSACLRGLHRSWSLLGSLSSFTYYLEVIFGTLRAAFHCLPASCRPAKQLEFATLFFFSFFVQFFFLQCFRFFRFCYMFLFLLSLGDRHLGRPHVWHKPLLSGSQLFFVSRLVIIIIILEVPHDKLLPIDLSLLFLHLLSICTTNCSTCQ